jgi:aspartyl-tRNA(Asn)/glutamyl-tRNA(Gln) amidotransferase subunit A
VNTLINLSLKETLKGLKSFDFSCQELVQSYVNKSLAKKDLNAYITDNFEQSLILAKESDLRLKAGTSRPLEGIPIAVKDNFCTRSLRTTCASRMLENFIPSYDSFVVERLKQAGAIVLAKANMDEFAMGSSNVTSYFGPVINPWKEKEKLVPGGSSGGSAAAVAARMAVAAIGSDTAGSIRQPAAFTGTVGIKPSYGRISRWGMVPLASSLDQAGVFARSVADAACVLSSVMGFHWLDSTSRNIPFDSKLSEEAKNSICGMRIGTPMALMSKGLGSDILEMWHKSISLLKDQGAIVEEVNIPYVDEALAVYYVISTSEASSNLSRFDSVRYGHRCNKYDSFDEMICSSRSEGFGEEVQRRILIGTYLLSAGFMDAYYSKAQRIRNLIHMGFTHIFENFDAVLLPTAPSTAFPLNAISDNPVDMYRNDIFTVLANLAGLPAISVPVALSNGLPLGMQLMTKLYDEASLIRLAGALERGVCKDFVPD